jgi:hypothetical protein
LVLTILILSSVEGGTSSFKRSESNLEFFLASRAKSKVEFNDLFEN